MTMKNPIVYSMFERSDPMHPSKPVYWGRMAMTSIQKEHFINPANLKRFKCIDCLQEFENVSKLSTHVTDKHMKFTYKCGDCEKIFCSKSALGTHRKSANACLSGPRGGGRLVLMNQCEACDKTFTTPHSRTFHTNSLVDGKCPGERMKEKRSARNFARNAKLNDDKAIKRKANVDTAKEGLKSAKGNFKNKSRAWKRKSVKNDATHMRDQCELDQCDQCDQVWQSGLSYNSAGHALSDAKGRVKTAKKKYGRKYQYRNIEIDLRTLANQLNMENHAGVWLLPAANSQDHQLGNIDSQLRTLDE